jgi:hypothetical protein
MAAPEKMPNEYARDTSWCKRRSSSVRPEVEIEAKDEQSKVINIMDALKKSMQAKGQAKVKDVVRKRMGKEPASVKLAQGSRPTKPTSGARRSVH